MFLVSPLKPSPYDSARFGLNVCRASYEDTDETTVVRELVDSMADVAIYRMPSFSSRCIDKLQGLGFEVIHAGALVYYTLDLSNYQPKPLRNKDLVITLAEEADDEQLAALARTSFNGYVSHYAANPLFPADKVLDGYCEWTLRHRLETNRTRTWVARRAGKIVAYACCEFDDASKICDGGIYGVLPSESSRGLFGDLIRYTQQYFRDLGFVEMRMSTKVGNFAVQKVWIREGYHLYEAYDTFHINALLSLGVESAETQPVRFSSERLAAVHGPDSADPAPDTADAGLILLDPELSASLRACYAHGNFAVLKASQLVLRPLQDDHEYSLSIRYPLVPAGDGSQPVVAILRDESGDLCVLGYYRVRIAPPPLNVPSR